MDLPPFSIVYLSANPPYYLVQFFQTIILFSLQAPPYLAFDALRDVLLTHRGFLIYIYHIKKKVLFVARQETLYQ